MEVTRVVEVPVEKILIRWHHRLGGWDTYAECIRRFEEAHPEAKVNEEEFPSGSAEYGPKIASLVAAGMAGDVTWTAIGSGSFQFLAQAGALAELDPLIEVDSSGFKLDEYYPRTVDGLRFGPAGHGIGPVCALPELAHAVNDCLFFNKTMFEKEGVGLPDDTWTLEDLLTAALALTKDSVFGYRPMTGDYSNIRNLTLAWGGELINEDGTKSLLEDDAVKQAIRWNHDLFFKHQVAPTTAQIESGYEEMFVAGQIAAYGDGGWGLWIDEAIEGAFEWDMVLLPKGPAGCRGGHLHVDGEAVFAESENKELAYEFAKHLTDLEAGVGIAQEIGLVARPDVYADPRIADDPHIVLLGKSAEEAFAHRGSANFRKQELQTTVSAIFEPLWTGDAQPDDAWFADASAELQEFLDKPIE
jgi:multiple sugar transport system substrate-binding protein